MNEKFLINYLEKYNEITLPNSLDEKNKIRALMNITMPYSLSEEFYKKQDEFLQQEKNNKHIVNASDICKNNQIAIFHGDITTIQADAIVNACNNTLLGCFVPGHYCIDNAIHSYAGLQVRRDLMLLMNGKKEQNGKCKVTKAYNLPSKFIFHTVGPIVFDCVTPENKEDLQNCYISCLKKADQLQLKSIAFCCLSTGEFSFPNALACDIAISTVKNYLEKTHSTLKVIFCTFKEIDWELYHERLQRKN